MNIAHETRDVKAIRKREFLKNLYLLAKRSSKVLSSKPSSNVRSILVYPSIDDTRLLADICNKICWGLPYKSRLNIYIPVSENFLHISLGELPTPKGQRSYLTASDHIIFFDKRKMAEYLKCDAIFIYDANKIVQFFSNLSISRTEIIDKFFFSYIESNVWKKYYLNTFSEDDQNSLKRLSRQNYAALLDRNKHKHTAYCFLTGPSFDRYKEVSFKNDGFKIICNSIVKNGDFLEFISGPDLLTFADPVFHFSPCEYSAKFRDHALSVIEKYDCFVMVPHETVPLLLAHYPQLIERIIGMEIAYKGREVNFPTLEKFFVKGAESIVTLFMIPVASGVSNNIFLMGADGRNPNENYFWKHSSSAQYDDLMETVFDTHPSFFRDRVYSEGYDKHCKYMESVFQYGEKLGKKYYSLTPSYIPALRRRYYKKTKLQKKPD